jgi:glycosyltransferase involved in cell wall biosynthesis
MRLAILNWRDIGHSDTGGAEVFVHQVARRWARAGHEVTLYSARSARLPVRDRADSVTIVRTGSLKGGTHFLLAPALARQEGADAILESINTFPYQLPFRRKRFPPFVTLVHQMAVDVWDAHLPTRLATAARAVEPLLFTGYRRRPVLAVSNSTASDLVRAGLNDVRVIPQGGIGRQDRRPKEAPPTLLFVGRLTANKRPHHALAAFSLVRDVYPDARMWVVGKGPLMLELSRSRPPGVGLLGRLTRGELLERMSRAHLLVSTSVREGWGLVITECNAFGTPAVAYRVPGVVDSVRHGETGYLTDPNPKALAQAILHLLGSPSVYSRMQEAAIEWGSRFTWDKTAKSLFRELESHVNSPAKDSHLNQHNLT